VILTTQFMRSMPLPSTCVYPSFRGHCFASDGKLHDVNVLDLLIPEPGAFYIMDRGHLHKTGRFFVIRAKSNTKIQASLLSSRGRIRWWCSMRSDHCAERSQVRA